MNYNSPLIEGRLIKRYKRFLADVKLSDGSEITAHCANTGAMTGCNPVNARVWLSESDNLKRKYKHSWELVELEKGAMACINTSITNKVALEGVASGAIEELAGYPDCQTEVRYGEESSRIDLLLSNAHEQCFVEVKHVTLKLTDQVGAFPDAVTTRGQKHLRELADQVKKGHRSVMLFIIMRDDVNVFTSADDIDPQYGQLLRQAAENGVEILAYATSIEIDKIKVTHKLPVHL